MSKREQHEEMIVARKTKHEEDVPRVPLKRRVSYFCILISFVSRRTTYMHPFLLNVIDLSLWLCVSRVLFRCFFLFIPSHFLSFFFSRCLGTVERAPAYIFCRKFAAPRTRANYFHRAPNCVQRSSHSFYAAATTAESLSHIFSPAKITTRQLFFTSTRVSAVPARRWSSATLLHSVWYLFRCAEYYRGEPTKRTKRKSICLRRNRFKPTRSLRGSGAFQVSV